MAFAESGNTARLTGASIWLSSPTCATRCGIAGLTTKAQRLSMKAAALWAFVVSRSSISRRPAISRCTVARTASGSSSTARFITTRILREGLESRGHVYRSLTDSETILHLYEERGLDFVNEIEGDFAIALWDAEREQLVLARDRIGVKPLYFYQQDGRFIFASEIKAILRHPGVTRELDEESLYHYLTFLTTPAPRTLFRNIQKLPAGHVLIVKRDGTTELKQYWDALPPETLPPETAARTEAQHSEEILRLLRDSIRKRMMSDVPFGVFLSGGVDSSANVALMSELMSQPVRTYTVGFEDNHELNELDSARAIANAFRHGPPRSDHRPERDAEVSA